MPYAVKDFGGDVLLLRPNGTRVVGLKNTPENRAKLQEYADDANAKEALKSVPYYGYEKRDKKGLYVYPAMATTERGAWIAVFVIGNGYSKARDKNYDSEQECEADCKRYNKFWGWTEEQVAVITANSMKGRYVNLNQMNNGAE